MTAQSVHPLTDVERANKVTAARFVEGLQRRRLGHRTRGRGRQLRLPPPHRRHGLEAGPEGMVAIWAGFEVLSPDSWHPIPILVAEGDYVAVLLPTYGHFTGRSDQASPPTGGRLDYGMVNMVRFDAGKLAEMWFGMDPLVELQQMGMAPASRPLPLSTDRAGECDGIPERLLKARRIRQRDGVRRRRRRLLSAAGEPGVGESAGSSHPVRWRRSRTGLPARDHDRTALWRGSSFDTATSRALVGRSFEDVLRDHGPGGTGRDRIPARPRAPDGDALRGWPLCQALAPSSGSRGSGPPSRISRSSTTAQSRAATSWRCGGMRGERRRATSWASQRLAESSTTPASPCTASEDGRIAEIWETRNTLGVLHELDPRIGGGHHHRRLHAKRVAAGVP